jgi:acyl-CoA synthetase (AMP-forming)/AMP-acid ligase II
MAPLELLHRLRLHATERPDAIAHHSLADPASELTWRELEHLSRSAADLFSEKLNPGETVIVCAANQPRMVAAILGALAAGVRVFPVHPDAAETELGRLAKQSGARAIVADASTLRSIGHNIEFHFDIDSFAASDSNSLWPNRPAGDLILQSSGTTGFPRLVLRRGDSLDSVSANMVKSIGYSASDCVLALLPLSHSYGLEHGLLAPVWAGSRVQLGRGLDMRIVARELSGSVTIFPAVPSVIEMLADSPATISPSLRRIYSAGAPLPPSVRSRFESLHRARVTQLYGLTEVGSITYDNPDDPSADAASVGLSMDGVSVRVLDPNDPSRALGLNEEGQIAVRASSMFERYLDESPSLVDGHFLTGDLGAVDSAGRVTISGRLKLLIDIGGLKVNPVEVELVLSEHPRVGSCVVIPIRQSETVWRLKAVATPRNPDDPPSVDELRALLRSRLAKYKVPRMFEVRATLPRTATGKVLRHLVETP